MAKLARFQRTITDDEGNIIQNASVEVRNEMTGNLASLFSDRTGLAAIGNPMAATDEGFAAFYIVGGAYRILATAAGFSREWRHEGIGTAGEYDASNLLFALPLWFGFSDKPGAGEQHPPFDIPFAYFLPEDAPLALNRARTAPTLEFIVSIVRKRGAVVMEIATATIDAGENEGVIACPAEVEFIAGDQIYPIMPDPHDATLADWSMTLVLRR